MPVVLWDTECDLGDSILEHVYCRGATAALIIADVTRSPTIDTAMGLAEAFELKFPGRPAVIVLNKIDLIANDALPIDARLARLGREHAAATSAKTGERVAEAIGFLADIIDRRGL